MTKSQKHVVLALRRLWKSMQVETGKIQTQAAKQLGITQGALSQFFNGFTELSDSMIIKFANFFKVDPIEIDLDIDDRLPDWFRLPKPELASGVTPPQQREIYMHREALRGCRVVELDCELAPLATKGAHIILLELDSLPARARLNQSDPDLWFAHRERIQTSDDPFARQWHFYQAKHVPKNVDRDQLWLVYSTVWV